MSSQKAFDPAFDNSGQGVLQVPGHALPLNYFPKKPENVPASAIFKDLGYFRYGAADFEPTRLVVREIAMLHTMNIITDKPNWEEKIFKDDIVLKWRSEAQENPDMSNPAFDWIVKELQDKANFSIKNKFIPVLDNASVCIKSDNLVPHELQIELQLSIEPLMNVPNPDWHPNSNEQVRNLVHPSLFPLVYGQSRILNPGIVGLENCMESAGKGVVLQRPANPWNDGDFQKDDAKLWSFKFQWLPCEVKFVGDHETDVKVTSYINNLHPVKHIQLYAAIEKLIALSIKPWNEILISGNYGRVPPRVLTFGIPLLDAHPPDWFHGLDYSGTDIPDEIRNKVLDFMAQPDGPKATPNDADPSIYNNNNWTQISVRDLKDALQAKARRRRRWELPEPGQGHNYEEWKQGNVVPVVKNYYMWSEEEVEVPKHEYYKVNLENDFRDRGLQVIVKIASIELSPEKPSYDGGNWHLEGMINEHIVATSIHYYDVANITDSSIRFRQQAQLPDSEMWNDDRENAPEQELFGCSMWDEPAVQEIGHINTKDGRFIAFPNTLQHRVQPFELRDKTKPGHRRFVVLWLVDPHLRIMSTANVPPQQHEWWLEEATKNLNLHFNMNLNLGATMSPEISDMITTQSDKWPMKLDEAKELRLELMRERTDFGKSVENRFGHYSLCEH